jgi:hypothetical protein
MYNYTESGYQGLLNNGKFKYVIIGKETDESDTPHLHGYGELATQMRFNRIKKDIHATTHFERRYGI